MENNTQNNNESKHESTVITSDSNPVDKDNFEAFLEKVDSKIKKEPENQENNSEFSSTNPDLEAFVEGLDSENERGEEEIEDVDSEYSDFSTTVDLEEFEKELQAMDLSVLTANPLPETEVYETFSDFSSSNTNLEQFEKELEGTNETPIASTSPIIEETIIETPLIVASPIIETETVQSHETIVETSENIVETPVASTSPIIETTESLQSAETPIDSVISVLETENTKVETPVIENSNEETPKGGVEHLFADVIDTESVTLETSLTNPSENIETTPLIASSSVNTEKSQELNAENIASTASESTETTPKAEQPKKSKLALIIVGVVVLVVISVLLIRHFANNTTKNDNLNAQNVQDSIANAVTFGDKTVAENTTAKVTKTTADTTKKEVVKEDIKVSTTPVKEEKKEVKTSTPKKGGALKTPCFIISYGAFSTEEKAKEQVDILKKAGLEAGYYYIPDYSDSKPLYKVYVGSFATKAEATKKLDAVKKLDTKAYVFELKGK